VEEGVPPAIKTREAPTHTPRNGTDGRRKNLGHNAERKRNVKKRLEGAKAGVGHHNPPPTHHPPPSSGLLNSPPPSEVREPPSGVGKHPPRRRGGVKNIGENRGQGGDPVAGNFWTVESARFFGGIG